MTDLNKILTVIVLIIGYFLVFDYKYEKFDLSKGWTGGDNNTDNRQQFDDALFYQYDSENDLPTGYNQCVKECNGVCVSYGLTGSAWCLPCLQCAER
jgi:hypothetical protein